MLLTGKLDQYVEIQKPITDTDEHGTPNEYYAKVKNIWCFIKPLRGREYFQADSIQSEITHKIYFRYDPGLIVKANWRIVDSNSVTYNIQYAIDVDNKHDTIECLAVSYGTEL